MRFALSFLVGAILAGLLWYHATPAYDTFLGRAATLLLHADPRLRTTIAEREGRAIKVRSVEDLAFPTATIPADQLTYNMILFGGLIAARRGRWRRTLVVVALLIVTHILAVTAAIESTYATRIAGWSDAHYGGTEQDFWTAAEYLYRLAGMFAIAFILWWMSWLSPAALATRPAAEERERERL